MSVRNKSDEVLALLCSRFPKTFFIYEGRRLPLKIGITRDLEAVLDEDVDRKTLRLAMKYYTSNVGYLHAQKAGTPRIDLDGNPSGEVAEDEANGAKARIAARKARPKPKPVVAKPAPITPPSKRDGLSALKKAAAKRRQVGIGGGS